MLETIAGDAVSYPPSSVPRHIIMLMHISITLTLMQGHSGLVEAKIKCGIISTTKQRASIKLATTVRHLLRDLDFANVYMV